MKLLAQLYTPIDPIKCVIELGWGCRNDTHSYDHGERWMFFSSAFVGGASPGVADGETGEAPSQVRPRGGPESSAADSFSQARA